ncbi:MAG TPA: hypothetical protein VM733_05220 [Thermoanaerobaculia bacterium]|nr:hypothetical protein [Thermoanaerobaculia bacterium]
MIRRAFLLTVLVSLALAASARPKLFTLFGKSGRTYSRVQLQVATADMKAVRVYAAPSGTLLGVFVNDAWAGGTAWVAKTFPGRGEAFPLASFEFQPGRASTLKTALPKIGDDGVEIYVLRGKKEEKFVVKTNPAEYTLEK